VVELGSRQLRRQGLALGLQLVFRLGRVVAAGLVETPPAPQPYEIAAWTASNS